MTETLKAVNISTTGTSTSRSPQKARPCVALRVCTALNAIAAGVWVLFLLELTAWGRSPISDYGAALGFVGLFFLIPSGAVSMWWLRRRRLEPLSASRRRYLRLSSAFLGTTWIVSCLPMIFWAGLLSLYLSTRWPINLREGPDTEFARARFEEHFGFSALGIDDLYCRRQWEFGDGNSYRMRFRFHDRATLDRLVEAARLTPRQADLSESWVVELDPPHWWPERGFAGHQQVFQALHGRPRLWVDEANGVAYYRSSP